MVEVEVIEEYVEVLVVEVGGKVVSGTSKKQGGELFGPQNSVNE